jgi:hypothetical protein
MSFKNSPYYGSIMQTQNFMYVDIQRCIDLDKLKHKGKKIGAPNFLIAVGLSCYTEYWGKLVLGLSRETDVSKRCYEEFLKRLGKTYRTNPYQQLLDKGVPVYEDIRCGLVHSYGAAKGCSVNLDNGNELCGICYDEINDHYDFNIVTYFKDFRNAVDVYVSGLGTGKESILKMNNAMKGKPLII